MSLNQPEGHVFVDMDGDGLCDYATDFHALERRCPNLERGHKVTKPLDSSPNEDRFCNEPFSLPPRSDSVGGDAAKCPQGCLRVGDVFSPDCDEVCAAEPAPELASAREREDGDGWLIERGGSPPNWWAGEFGGSGTTDPLKAVRFARREDAETVMRYMPDGHLCRATEHVWLVASARAALEPEKGE